MRSLLAKSSVTILIMLALGSGLTLAATSSEPGMFLYPIKRTTQKLTGATGHPLTPLTPVIGTSNDMLSPEGALPEAGGQEEAPPGGDGQPPANIEISAGDTQSDGAGEAEVTGTGQANEITGTPSPTPARAVDELTVKPEPDANPGGGSETVESSSSGPPAIEQLDSGFVDGSQDDDGQPQASKTSDLDNGPTGKKENSNDNDNHSGHSNSDHDNGSNENSEDHED